LIDFGLVTNSGTQDDYIIVVFKVVIIDNGQDPGQILPILAIVSFDNQSYVLNNEQQLVFAKSLPSV
jgi:hypothetical protein